MTLDLSDMDDESLMLRVQSQDHQAFSLLVQRHTQRFFACAYRTLGHVQECEDVVQEAFIKLWQKPGGWDASKGVKFTTWFYRVVTNRALDVLRARKPNLGSGVLDFMADERQNVAQDFQDKEDEDLIERAIHSLPERQRTALNLCFYEGLSQKDAAQIMGVQIKALESLLMRAKTGARDYLIREGLMEVKHAG